MDLKYVVETNLQIFINQYKYGNSWELAQYIKFYI